MTDKARQQSRYWLTEAGRATLCGCACHLSGDRSPYGNGKPPVWHFPDGRCSCGIVTDAKSFADAGPDCDD